jgi:hypothetical protein
MPSVFELLDQIEQHPSIYLGGDTKQRILQLQNLELLLAGYALALRAHNLDETVEDFVRDFGEYLRRTRGWSASCGPVAAIRDAVGSDSGAWELFWRLVKEYRASFAE